MIGLLGWNQCRFLRAVRQCVSNRPPARPQEHTLDLVEAPARLVIVPRDGGRRIAAARPDRQRRCDAEVHRLAHMRQMQIIRRISQRAEKAMPATAHYAALYPALAVRAK